MPQLRRRRARSYLRRRRYRAGFLPLLLEVAAGTYTGVCVSEYARRCCCGVTVLSVGGAASNLELRQPDAKPPGSLVIATPHGQFEMVSLTGTVLPLHEPLGASNPSVYVTSGQGQVKGGSVVGQLIAAGPGVPMAALFANVIYERLQLENISCKLRYISASPSLRETWFHRY